MNNKKIIIPILIFLLSITNVIAGIDSNGTITCPPGAQDIEGICNLIQGPTAGLAIFLDYISSPLGLLVASLVAIGVIAAIGLAIAFAVKNLAN